MLGAHTMQVMVDALEVWDYSRHNIQNYARRVAEAQPRLQYLPFSFLSFKSNIGLGADSTLGRHYPRSVTRAVLLWTPRNTMCVCRLATT